MKAKLIITAILSKSTAKINFYKLSYIFYNFCSFFLILFNCLFFPQIRSITIQLPLNTINITLPLLQFYV